MPVVTGILGSIALVLVFVLIGGLFAGAEMALVTLRDSQIRGLAERGPRGRRVAALASNPNRFLAAVQIGMTLANFFSAAFGEATLSSHLEPVFEGAGLSAGFADAASLIVITLIVAYFALVLGELSPKRIALQRTEGIAMLVARPLDRIARIVAPAIWLLSRSTDLVVRLLGGDPGSTREGITEEELRGLVAAHEALSHDERAVIDDVFAAADRQVREVMAPRTEVEFLDGSLTLSRARKLVAGSPHSRYPVIGRNHDDVIGFIHIRDLVAGSQHGDRTVTVADIAREVRHLPGSKKVLAALSEMRAEGQHVAIVADEYGGTAGIVTLEDLIEEIIGDIRDEYDEADAPPVASPPGELDVDGLRNLDDFADETGTRLPDGPYETVAGYLIAVLGRLPKVGDTTVVGGRQLCVTELDGRRVSRLHVGPVRRDEFADHDDDGDVPEPAAAEPSGTATHPGAAR